MPFARVRRIALATVLTGGAVAGTCSGCSSALDASSGGPPLVICGQTLWNAAAGAVLTDVTGDNSKITIRDMSAGFLLFLKLSNSCQTGVSLSWTPTSAAKIVLSARTQDGKLAAVDLQPLAKTFTLVVTTNTGKVNRIPVALSMLPVMHGTPTTSPTEPTEPTEPTGPSSLTEGP